MFKAARVLVLLFLSGNTQFHVWSQNLVLNPKMIETKLVATDFNKITCANGWSSATKGTVDLFSWNASKKKNGIPQNRQGIQAIPDSTNYAGIIAYADPKEKRGYSEYLQGELSSILEKGRTYHVSFRVSLSEKSTRAVGGLGAVLSKAQLKERHSSVLRIQPHIQSTSIVSDTKSWIEISGHYTAKGDEKWIILGAFGDQVNVLKVKNDLKYKENRAYYYVSDVIVCPFDTSSSILNEEENKLLEDAIYGIKFETDQDVILDTSFVILNKIVDMLKRTPSYSLTIEGHTDSDGGEKHNLDLSKRRADAVKEYLVRSGVSLDRITSVGYGAKYPKEDNTTVKGKSMNRRVEFKIK